MAVGLAFQLRARGTLTRQGGHVDILWLRDEDELGLRDEDDLEEDEEDEDDDDLDDDDDDVEDADDDDHEEDDDDDEDEEEDDDDVEEEDDDDDVEDDDDDLDDDDDDEEDEDWDEEEESSSAGEATHRMSAEPIPLRPPWIKARAPIGEGYERLRTLMRGLDLHTVCEEAHCPNIGDCWKRGTATLMILGDVCTRACGFCAVKTGLPRLPPDPLEPQRVAAAVARM